MRREAAFDVSSSSSQFPSFSHTLFFNSPFPPTPPPAPNENVLLSQEGEPQIQPRRDVVGAGKLLQGLKFVLSWMRRGLNFLFSVKGGDGYIKFSYILYWGGVDIVE